MDSPEMNRPNRLRLAQLVAYFPSASETFVAAQAAGALRRGLDVEVLALRPEAREPGGRFPDERVIHYDAREAGAKRLLRVSNAILRRSAVGRTFTRYLASRFRRVHGAARGDLMLAAALASRSPYDVMHCQFGPQGLRAMRLREEGVHSSAIVTSFLGFDLTRALIENGRGYYSRLLSSGELFLPLSRRFAELLCSLGAPEDRVLVHRLGVDLKEFRLRSEPPASASLRIASVARLVEKKGLEFGLRAVSRLAARGVDVRYRIAGDGPLLEELRDLARRLDVDQKVELLGEVSHAEARQLMEASDLLIAPSVTARDGDEEGMGLVLAEAMALGVPVVATRHDGIPELVEHERTGLLVPERGDDALAEAILRLRDEPELGRALTENARARIEREFDIESWNDLLVSRYAEAVERRRAAVRAGAGAERAGSPTALR